MKLKTKFQDEDFDLGEVIEANIYHAGSRRIKVIAESAKGGMITFYFKSLKGLNEMFEDYEEPKEFYFISGDGGIANGTFITENICRYSKEIGNYFSSREEAEKAVEKLKAWQRLEEAGAEFYGWRRNQTGTYELYMRWHDRIPRSYEVKKDLDLLFSGGEE